MVEKSGVPPLVADRPADRDGHHLASPGVALRLEDPLEVLVEQRLVLERHPDVGDPGEVERLVGQELDQPGALEPDILEEVALARLEAAASAPRGGRTSKSGKAMVSTWRRRCRRL